VSIELIFLLAMNTSVLNIICGHNNCGYPHMVELNGEMFFLLMYYWSWSRSTHWLAKGGLLHVAERFELDFKSGVGGAFCVRVRQLIAYTLH